MNKLIFICVFNSIKYVEMLLLLLESIDLFAQLDENTTIMIYTSSEFKRIIESNTSNRLNIIYRINDNYNDIYLSCRARLDLFQLEGIEAYDKILYLDTDILIRGNINRIFNAIEQDILYAMHEDCKIGDHPFHWGRDIYINRREPVPNALSFSSGVLAFNNCDNIRELFEIINEHMKQDRGTFYDQPFIVYHATNRNLINATRLVPEVTTKYDIHRNTDQNIVIHFAGGPGVYTRKIPDMTNYLAGLKNRQLSKLTSDVELEQLLSDMM